MSETSQPANQHPKRWRRINNILLGAVVIINLYVIAVPFVPQLLFMINAHNGEQAKLEQAIAPQAGADNPAPTAKQGNHLIVPSMLLDQPLIEGSNMYRSLDKGVWRWPGSSTPDKGGNTVLLGHRFTYTQPKGVFYFLDKVAVGDYVGIVWNSKTYRYKVTEVKVVKPTQTDILDPTDKPTLTMYTCTPLWLPKDRLVVRGELEASP